MNWGFSFVSFCFPYVHALLVVSQDGKKALSPHSFEPLISNIVTSFLSLSSVIASITTMMTKMIRRKINCSRSKFYWLSSEESSERMKAEKINWLRWTRSSCCCWCWDIRLSVRLVWCDVWGRRNTERAKGGKIIFNKPETFSCSGLDSLFCWSQRNCTHEAPRHLRAILILNKKISRLSHDSFLSRGMNLCWAH